MRTTDETGAVTGRFEYNAYGRLLTDEPPTEGTRYGFSSPAWMRLKDDPDMRWYLTRTRIYDAWAGIFAQKDPQTGIGGRRGIRSNKDAMASRAMAKPQNHVAVNNILNPAQWNVILKSATEVDNYAIRQGNNPNAKQAVGNLLSMMWAVEVASAQGMLKFENDDVNLYAYSDNPLLEADPTGQAFINCMKALAKLEKEKIHAAIHLADNTVYLETHGTLDPGHVREKQQIVANLAEALEKVIKHCLKECPRALYEKAKEVLAEIKKQLDAFADAVANLDWVAALTALRNALIAVAIFLALVLAVLAGMAAAAA